MPKRASQSQVRALSYGPVRPEMGGDGMLSVLRKVVNVTALMRYHPYRLQPPEERACSPRSAGRCEVSLSEDPLLLWSGGGEGRKHNPQWSVSAPAGGLGGQCQHRWDPFPDDPAAFTNAPSAPAAC